LRQAEPEAVRVVVLRPDDEAARPAHRARPERTRVVVRPGRA
jgi:hypothetical protein